MVTAESKWDQALEWFLDTPKGRISFLLLHFMIGAVGFKFRPILFLHHALIAFFGLRQLFSRRPKTLWLVFVFGSFAVCEVLWRTYAPYFSDKQSHYISIALGFVFLIKQRFRSSPITPWIILALLLVSSLHFSGSFVGILSPALLRVYLLPYLTLAVTWSVMVSWDPCDKFWPRFLVICSAGALSVGAFAALSFGIFSVQELASSGSSFSATQAPNQFSVVFGFGGSCALLVPVLLNLGWVEIVMWLLAAGFLFERTVLSMSRGGLYGAAAALIPIVCYIAIAGRARQRWMLVGWISLGFLVATVSIWQGGSGVQDRWTNTNPTGRVDNFERELDIAKNTWLTGSGLGGSWVQSGDMTSHTEVTRLLAEHGLFGALILLTLLIAAWASLRRSNSSLDLAMRSGMFLWCLVTQMHNSIRLALVFCVFSFAMAKSSNVDPMKRPKALGS